MNSRMRVRPYVPHLLLALLVVLAIEGMARLAHAIRPLYEDKTFLYVDHASYHHWRRPNAHGRYRALTGEFTTEARTNSLGMAGGEISLEKTPGVSRIVVLGDSFVEGFATAEDSILTRFVEADLRAEEPVEVLNLGCASYSPSLEYFLLTDLGARLHPDAVVLVFHATDVTDDWRYDAHVVRDAGREPVAIDGTQSKSLLYRWAEKFTSLRIPVQYWKTARRQREIEGQGATRDLTETFDAIFKHTYSTADIAAWDLTIQYIVRIRDWTRERSIPLLLVALPVGTQIEPAHAERRAKMLIAGEGGLLRSTKLQDVLAGVADELAVHYLDLLPAFQTHEQAFPEELLFYPLDQHLTGRGNRVAARAIASSLREVRGLNARSEPESSE